MWLDGLAGPSDFVAVAALAACGDGCGGLCASRETKDGGRVFARCGGECGEVGSEADDGVVVEDEEEAKEAVVVSGVAVDATRSAAALRAVFFTGVFRARLGAICCKWKTSAFRKCLCFCFLLLRLNICCV